MRFTKMHGLGNCYLFIDCFERPVDDAPALARAMSDRNTGVGSDGLIALYPSRSADARMEIYNLDGSRPQMCGNGIRCAAKYLYEHGLARSNPMRIETDAGVRVLELFLDGPRVREVRVDMGAPRLAPEDLPVRLPADQMVDRPIRIRGHDAAMTCVSMGNPHAILFGLPLDMFRGDGREEWLAVEGRRIETDPMFPERVNVHFVEVHSPDEVTMLTWERGSGATQACGTGASAVCVAGVLTGRTGRAITAHLPGGDLSLEWNASNDHVFMRGPAVEIFTGDWPTD